jgi:hypothetical protein
MACTTQQLPLPDERRLALSLSAPLIHNIFRKSILANARLLWHNIFGLQPPSQLSNFSDGGHSLYSAVEVSPSACMK